MTTPKSAKVAEFFAHRSADIVDQLMPYIDTVRDQMAQFVISSNCATSPFLLILSNNQSENNARKCSIELVNALRKVSVEDNDDGDQLLMAFCCALLTSGCCLELMCAMFRMHLVNSKRLEQFAKMNAIDEMVTMDTITLVKLTTNNAMSVGGGGANEENDENGDSAGTAKVSEENHLVRRQRKDFLQLHNELFKLMLVDTDKMAMLLYRWNSISWPMWEYVKNESNPALKVQNLVALLLNDPSTLSFDHFCVALLLTQQFKLFSICHEFGNIQQMQFLLQNFVVALQKWRKQLAPTKNAPIVCMQPIKAVAAAADTEQTQQTLPSLMAQLLPNANLGEGDEEMFLEMPEGILKDFNFTVTDADTTTGSRRMKTAEATAADLTTFYNEHKNEIYPNFAIPRGLALVINNYRFSGGMQPREGTQTDRENIVKLLEQLKYNVLLRNDLKAKEMMWAIRHFAQQKEAHERANSAIVVVLSHGEHDTLLGTDEMRINLHQFVAELNSQNCPHLIGKPKIFVIQACRGDIKDPGVPRAVPVLNSEEDSADGAVSSKAASNNSKKGPLSVFSRNNSPRNSLAPASLPLPFHLRNGESSIMPALPQLRWIKEPTNADILIAQSTTAHYVSWRNSARGTWFVQSLCRVFSRWAAQEDICQMLTRVHAEVSAIEGSTPERAKQVPEMNSTLRKRFFFFPGMEKPMFE